MDDEEDLAVADQSELFACDRFDGSGVLAEAADVLSEPVVFTALARKVSGEVQEARPEVASVPAQLIVTEWLYQPFTSAPRPAEAVAAGAVSSNLSGYVTTADELPA